MPQEILDMYQRQGIITVSGNIRGAGKTTFKKIFMETAQEYGVPLAKESFVEPVERAVAWMISTATKEDTEVVYQKMSDPNFKYSKAQPTKIFDGKTVNDLIESMGRKFGPDGPNQVGQEQRVRLLKDRVEEDLKEYQAVVVDDTCFANEHTMLQKLAAEKQIKFVDVFIEVPLAETNGYVPQGELDFIKQDARIHIVNGGSLEEFEDRCREASKRIVVYLLMENTPEIERAAEDCLEYLKYYRESPVDEYDSFMER